MQRKAEQGTFGGRFGGRKSLQSRKSGRFGGTFGGRNSQTETKLMHVRRHLRRPKLPSRAESPLSGAGFGSRYMPLQAGSAAERAFGCRTWFLPKGRNLVPTCTNASQLIQTCIFLFYNMHTQAYKLLGASNYPKPHLQHIKHA